MILLFFIYYLVIGKYNTKNIFLNGGQVCIKYIITSTVIKTFTFFNADMHYYMLLF